MDAQEKDRGGLAEAAAFIWREADMLDRGAYDEWLTLWTHGGKYVVPIEPASADFDTILNYAFDDHMMREIRVRRLVNGQSGAFARTVRTVSRFVTVRVDAEMHELRCAQVITVYTREETRQIGADLIYRLALGPRGPAIDHKVVRLLNPADALACFGFML